MEKVKIKGRATERPNSTSLSFFSLFFSLSFSLSL